MEKVCYSCKKIFLGRANQLYCKAPECQRAMHKAAEERYAAKVDNYKYHPRRKKHCKYCNKEFMPKENGASVKFCSSECYRKDRNARRRKPLEKIELKCEYCGKIYLKSPRSKENKYCSNTCRSRVWERKREELLKSVKRDKGITLQKIVKRDKGICYLCGEPIDWNDHKDNIYYGKYPSIDHVKPLSKGGDDTWDNVKLAHMSCNSKKGASEYD